MAGTVALTPAPLMADQMTEDAALFEIPLSTSDVPERWRLDHGPLPAKAQITLQYEDGSAFSGVQFFGQRGAIPPGSHQIIAEQPKQPVRDSLRVRAFIWTPSTGLRPAAPGEITLLEPLPAR
ncbi:hypothetical protein [Thalassovita sp.]|uniref:hypothetical protein n=1 Tax=Thalassovita sp. TaxID=1979401 RepID=UPI002AAFB5EA|nr:hypothetical protein [Thalassovita sp.]